MNVANPAPGLSAVVITKNEERYLERLLESVRFADEVIVVDSGSTDATLQIARRYTDRVVHNDWPGFGPQKNFGIDLATREWVLCLDADEEVTPELARSIDEVVSGRRKGHDVYSMPRLTRFIDRFMRHGGWYPDRQLRLLRKGVARYGTHPVHAAIEHTGKAGKLSGDLLHYSYDSIEDYVERMNSYSSTMAEAAIAEGRTYKATALSLAWLLARKFLEVYVYKRGFLDGRYGLVVACLASYGVFLRQAKIWKPEAQAKEEIR